MAGKQAKPKRIIAKAVPIAERWTVDKRAAFLAALTELANVAAAARVAGVPEHSPYQLKASDAGFAEAWEAAIDEGYARLELLLLRRATFGEHADGEDAPQISTALALGLLKSRQAIARRGPPRLPAPVRGAKLRDRLEAKLGELNRRLVTDG